MSESELGRILANGKLDRRTKKFNRKSLKKVNRSEQIDWAKVDDLLIAGCTGEEVGSFFGVTSSYMRDQIAARYGMHFSDYRYSLKQKGESILRAHQFAKALGVTKDGDNTLLIWLGKQRLGQTETPSDATISESAVKNFNALMTQLDRFHKDNDS